VYLHEKGKIAEYKMIGTVSGFEIWVTQTPGFPEELYIGPGWSDDNWLESLNEALQVAMDYHETEGCALYLELYPAPEKGEYHFIAQDADGAWNGYTNPPRADEDEWKSNYAWFFIEKSPPNPFWRKTLR